MKVTVLGSAAAEGIPALWCECTLCRRAFEAGGRDWRRRTGYAVDQDTLIDFSPDIRDQVLSGAVDLTRVRRILFTHSHSDHLNAFDLAWRRSPNFSRVTHDLAIYGNTTVLDRIRDRAFVTARASTWGALKIAPTELRRGGWYDAGSGVRFLAIPARHAPPENSYNFAVEKDRRRILFANDTGFWSEETWPLVRGLELDAAIIECTLGLQDVDLEAHPWHLNAGGSVAFRDRLLAERALKREAPVWVNHFSHNAGALHDELAEWFRPHGIAVAYDNLTIEL